MPTVLEVLHQIHQVRLELVEVRQQLERGPLQLKGSQNQVNKKAAATGALRDQLKQLRKEGDAEDLTLKAGDQRLRDLRAKLNATTNAKEFAAVKVEIARVEAVNGELETTVLGLMNDQELKQATIADADRELAAAKAEHDKLRDVIEYQQQKMTERAKLLEGMLTELEIQLDSTPLSDYRRLTKLRGDKALAECRDGTCTSCFTRQTPQAVNELNLNKTTFCHTCGAMLYRTGVRSQTA